MDQTVAAPARISETPPITITDSRLIADVGTTVWIPLEYIVPNPDQPRKFFDKEELEAMAESYKHRGDVEKALDVILRNDSTIAFIQDGESRWRSAKIAALTGVSCYICPDKSDDEIFLSSSIANIRRKDFTIIEKALAIFQIQQRFKLTEAEAGAQLGYKPSQTIYLLKFLDLDEKVQQLLIEGKLGSATAYQLASYAPEHQELGHIAVKKAVKENGGKPITSQKAARVIRKALEKKGIKPKQRSRGRETSTSAQLVARNLMTHLEKLRPALREFIALPKKDIEKLLNPHYLDIIQEMAGTQKELAKAQEKMATFT
jgi:ParB family chromosome partitioning protein